MTTTKIPAPPFTPAPPDARYCVVYFDARLVALGTDKGQGEYAGTNWHITEAMHVTGDPTGKTFMELRAERAEFLRARGRLYEEPIRYSESGGGEE